MTDTEYNQMVDNLIFVTKNGKLNWTENNEIFYTEINGCPLSLDSDYDPNINSAYARLSLSNSDKVVFATYTYYADSNKEEYEKLMKLWEAIRDKLYQISVSEKKIFDALNDMAFAAKMGF